MDVQGIPWILYPGDVGERIEKKIYIEQFVFSNYDDSEHRCTLEDLNGRPIFDERGSNDFSLVTVEPGRMPFDGFVLQRLDSGTLKIYIR